MKKDEFKNMHDYQSGVDALDVWAAIEPQVDALNGKRRKRKGIAFWWLGTGMLLFVLGGAYWGLSDGFDTQNSQIQITNATSVDSNLAELVEAERCEEINAKNQKINSQSSIINSNSQNLSVISFAKNEGGINPKIQKTNNKYPISDTETRINKQKITIIEPAAIKNNEQSKTMKMTVLSEKEEPTTIFSTTKKGNTFESILKIPMIAFTYFTIENEQTYPVLVNKQQQLNVAKTPKLPEDTPSSDRNFMLSIGMQGGVSFVNRNMKAKEANADALLQLRKSTESVLEAHHYGLQLTAVHRSGFELTFGVNKTTIAERFDYLGTTVDTSMTYGLRYIYTDIEGQTNNIYDSIPLVETMIMTKKIYNSHQLLEIPLTVGYSKAWKSWKVGAQVGVLVNVSLQTEGKIMNGVGVIIQIEEQDTPIYKTKIGLGYHFGLSLEREILPNVNLSISPFVRAYATDFTPETYRISQKYTLFGGNVGLRYQFGK